MAKMMGILFQSVFELFSETSPLHILKFRFTYSAGYFATSKLLHFRSNLQERKIIVK